MNKMQMLFAGTAMSVVVVIILIIGALGIIGFLYLKSNPAVGDYNYSNYNGSSEIDINITSNATTTPTPTATPTASPTVSPSPSASATPTATPTATPSPTPSGTSDCATFEGKSNHADKVCAANQPSDNTVKYVWECQDGTWAMVETCSSASKCSNGVCS